MAIKVVHSEFLVAGTLLLATWIICSVAEATTSPADPTFHSSSVASVESVVGEGNSSSFSVEFVLRNMAQESVTFQLGSELLRSGRSGVGGEEVEVQTGQWGAMGPVEVSVEHPPVVQVFVMVKVQTRSAPVKKVLHINLGNYAFDDGEMLVKGARRSVVVTAMESWRLKSGKYLVVQVGTQWKMALSFKL